MVVAEASPVSSAALRAMSQVVRSEQAGKEQAGGGGKKQPGKQLGARGPGLWESADTPLPAPPPRPPVYEFHASGLY